MSQAESESFLVRKRGLQWTVERLEDRRLLTYVAFDSATYVVGQNPTGVVVGSFYGTSSSDIAVANHDSGTLSLLRNNGNGTFQAAQTISLGGHTPNSLVAGDFNGDQKTDLAVSLADDNSVAILLGNGNGTFQAPVLYPVGSAPMGMAVADLDNRNGPDLVVADSGSDQLSVLLNNGDGTFTAAATISTPSAPHYVTAADIDKDGNVDLAVAGPGVNLYWGNGDGTFTAPTSFGVAGGAQGSIQVVDAHNDLAVDSGSGNLVGFPHSSGRSFFGPSTLALPAAGQDLQLGNFGAIAPDAAVLLPTGSSGSVAIADGDESGGFLATQSNFPIGLPANAMTVGDFNGDGFSDIALATTSGQLQVLTFAPVAGIPVTQNSYDPTPAIALFSDAAIPWQQSQAFLANFSASVNWGDGSVSPTQILMGPANTQTLAVNAEHLYANDGTYTITTTIRDNLGNVGVVIGTDTVTDAPLPATLNAYTIGGSDEPDYVAPAPSGDVWFGEDPTFAAWQLNPNLPSSVGLISPSGVVNLYQLPDSGPGPRRLASDAAGNAWTTGGLGKIDRVNPSGQVMEFPFAPTAYALTSGPDGNIWFVSGNGTVTDHVGYIDSTGQITLIPLSAQTGVVANITFAADGNLWATEGSSGIIARITPQGVVTEFHAPLASNGFIDPSAITMGPDGNAWFTSQTGKVVGRITSAGTVTEFPTQGDPVGITTGPDGALWVTDFNSHGIERITSTGSSTVYKLPGTFPLGIAYSGPTPNIWSALNGSNEIVRLDLTRAVVLAATPLTTLPAVLFSGNVATFTHPVAPLTSDPPGNYAAMIDWGDGSSPTAGNITVATNGSFVISGSHTYTSEGLRNVEVTAGALNDTAQSIFVPMVVDYPLAAGNTLPVFAAAGLSTGTVHVFAFQDSDPNGIAGQFTATISWGDGSAATQGTVTPGAAAGAFIVSGVKTYSGTGSFPVHIHVADSGGSTIDADTSATVIRDADVVSGTAAADTVVIKKDAAAPFVDWSLGSASGQLLINDPNGLTINGNGGNDTITLDYTNGNALPNLVHLNSGTGNFTIDGLQGTNPLAGTTLDIGRSTVFISYSGSDPITAIQSYLHNGYNAGAWNGTPTASTGVITSAAAQANPNRNTAIGYADWADGQGLNMMLNTIELTYTLYGDANLDHQVNSADLQILLAFLNRPGSWDQGDFNYDAQVNSADLQVILFTFNTSLGSQTTPLAVAAPAAATKNNPPAKGTSSRSIVPSIETGASTAPHASHPAKPAARKRR